MFDQQIEKLKYDVDIFNFRCVGFGDMVSEWELMKILVYFLFYSFKNVKLYLDFVVSLFPFK